MGVQLFRCEVGITPVIKMDWSGLLFVLTCGSTSIGLPEYNTKRWGEILTHSVIDSTDERSGLFSRSFWFMNGNKSGGIVVVDRCR